MTKAEYSTNPCAIRKRRWDGRQRKRMNYAEADVPHSLTAHLIESGFLSEPDAFIPKKIGEALMRYVQSQRKRNM